MFKTIWVNQEELYNHKIMKNALKSGYDTNIIIRVIK